MTKSASEFSRLKKIDEKLYKIAMKIHPLFWTKPLNLEEEKLKVFKNPNYNPKFKYKKRPPSFFKKLEEKLESLKFKDTPLDKIFKAKKEELKKALILGRLLGKENFTEASISLFGKPSKEILKIAKRKLKKIKFKEKEKAFLKTEIIKIAFKRRLNQYGLSNWEIKLKENLPSLATVVSKKNKIYLRKNIFLSKERVLAMIRHEIDCHVLKSENGKIQPYKIFFYGFPNYVETEEGHATYMTRKLPFKTKKRFFAPLRVILIDLALKSSFSTIFKEALKFGLNKNEAWRICSRIKRGLENTEKPGAFTKDWLYFKGYLKISEMIKRNQIDETILFLGKISLDFLKEIKEIKEIKKPRFYPLPLSLDFLKKL